MDNIFPSSNNLPSPDNTTASLLLLSPCAVVINLLSQGTVRYFVTEAWNLVMIDWKIVSLSLILCRHIVVFASSKSCLSSFFLFLVLNLSFSISMKAVGLNRLKTRPFFLQKMIIYVNDRLLKILWSSYKFTIFLQPFFWSRWSKWNLKSTAIRFTHTEWPR